MKFAEMLVIFPHKITVFGLSSVLYETRHSTWAPEPQWSEDEERGEGNAKERALERQRMKNGEKDLRRRESQRVEG